MAFFNAFYTNMTGLFVGSQQIEEGAEPKNVNNHDEKNDDNDHSIQKIRDWVDRYEEAVTNHYSQELRARLSAVQVNGVHSDLKFSATLRSVEKCKTSLLSTGGKVCYLHFTYIYTV